MKMVSYWKHPIEVYDDKDLIIIIGNYDHKNKEEGGYKALGIHWNNYPTSNGILCPCVIPESTRNAILSGLLHQAVTDKNENRINSITKAIEFFME